MRVLFLVTENFRMSQTGAGTQVRETVNALKEIGVDVSRVYVSFKPTRFYDEDGQELSREALVAIAKEHDVAHLIHCSRWLAEVWRTFPKMPTVGSTIYWGGWERVQMALKTHPLGWRGIKAALNYVRSMTSSYLDLRGVDVLLPNSHAESMVVRKYARLSKGAKMFPVNNGFLQPNFALSELARPDYLPGGEYIVVPGIFANRKNQLGLIKSLRDLPYEVVFVGGFTDGDWYYNECRRHATDRMRFLGYVQHDSHEYWSILYHARCAVLASDCETPGIAMIEASFAGARPVITKFGGTVEYYGFDAEYFDPRCENEIREAVERGWRRGRLSETESSAYSKFSWRYCACLTKQAYDVATQDIN